MANALVQTNCDLLHQVRALRQTLCEAKIPSVLKPYRTSVDQICADIENRLQRNLQLLESGIDSLHSDVLYDTSNCWFLFDLVNNRLAAALIRAHVRDKLALSIIQWLHNVHEQTRNKPFAIYTGQFAVYPDEHWPVIYFIPTSSQVGLRYLPLVFHEFGHLLYALAKPEMDDLVEEFQRSLKRVLAPRAIRDGQPTNNSTRQKVLTAWHDYWLQEVFCDAVGLTIGGRGFLYAFSHYFQFRSSQEYFRRQQDQLLRRHPVTVLRIQLLVDRAERLGLAEHSSMVQKNWRFASKLYGVSADYQGTWDDSLRSTLQDLVDDMLEETSPFDFRQADDSCPQSLIDADWDRFNASSEDFMDSEQASVSQWMDLAGT